MAKKQPPMVISYLRFSRMEQLKGDSTRRQLDASESYAKKRGWTITDNLADKGISAYRGANATTGSLAKLLDLVKAKKIPAGSVLLVESLDRLSRNQINKAYRLFSELIESGLTIITLADGFEYTEDNMDLANMMYSLMVLSRANEESAIKSKRLSEAWKNKRANIETKPLTAQLPAWLKLDKDAIVVDEKKAAVVKRMFQLALQGHGLTAITKKLNQEGIILGKAKVFHRSYVFKTLHNRAVLGEFQPHTVTYESGKRARKPAGDPIKGYYPAIVPEQDFYAVHQKMTSKLNHGGPASKNVNLFKGLVFCDGSPLYMMNKSGVRAYASSAAILGVKGAEYIGFPIAAFESALFSEVVEAKDLKLEDNRTADMQHQLEAAKGKLAAVCKRVEDISTALADTSRAINTAIIPILATLTEERGQLEQQVEDIKAQLAALKQGSPQEAQAALFELLHSTLDETVTDEQRLALQQLIRQLVKRIDCQLSRENTLVTCCVVVTLATGETREYAATVDTRSPKGIRIDAAGNRRYVGIWHKVYSDEKQASTSLFFRDMARRYWQQGMHPDEICRQCGVTVSTVYRLTKGLPRLKPAPKYSRWNPKPATKG